MIVYRGMSLPVVVGRLLRGTVPRVPKVGRRARVVAPALGHRLQGTGVRHGAHMPELVGAERSTSIEIL
jgi:hypothetical protein